MTQIKANTTIENPLRNYKLNQVAKYEMHIVCTKYEFHISTSPLYKHSMRQHTTRHG